MSSIVMQSTEREQRLGYSACADLVAIGGTWSPKQNPTQSGPPLE